MTAGSTGELLAAAEASASGWTDEALSAIPGTQTPDILDGTVYALTKVGNTIVVGGTFTQVKDRRTGTVYAVTNLVAFDASNGVVLSGFRPALDERVLALKPGPNGTVVAGGRFTRVNGTAARVARLALATGNLATGWVSPSFTGDVQTIAPFGSELLVGGLFKSARDLGGSVSRKGMMSLAASSGAITDTVTSAFVGQHVTQDLTASAGVGVRAIAVSSDESQVVAIGNFIQVDGLARDQVAMLRPSGGRLVVDAGWKTLSFTAQCGPQYATYMRDVDFAPDGSWFAIATTGSGTNSKPLNSDGTRGLCDSATRWESATTGANVLPTWSSFTGNDSLWSVAATPAAIYVGGHQRWVNNAQASDRAGPGAIPRPGIGALDPASGMPLAWNPGRNPRGGGAYALLKTDTGLYVGSDTSFIGNRQYRRERVAFFPTTAAPAQDTTVGGLPGVVYTAGGFANAGPWVVHRVDIGGPATPSHDGGIAWSADSGSTSSVISGTTTLQSATVVRRDDSVEADTPTDVFRTQRIAGTKTMRLTIAAPVGKQVEVRLPMIETAYAAAGKRVVDVFIDGRVVAKDFDLYAAAGRFVAHTVSTTVISDGTIDISLVASVGRPQLAGVEIVVPGTAPVDPSGDATRAVAVDSGGQVTPVASDLPAAAWHSARGAFVVNGGLYYLTTDGFMHRRTRTGSGWGPDHVLDPYNDPLWSDVLTGSTDFGQTYRGLVPGFVASEAEKVSGMFFSGGRIYYTLTGQPGMYTRFFAADTGAVGTGVSVIADSKNWSDTCGMFLSGGTLYWASCSSGYLFSASWDGTKAGSSVRRDSSRDWAGRALFLRGT